MDFNNSQKKFEDSCQKLAENLSNLEQVIFAKIKANSSKNYFDQTSLDNSTLIYEQNIVIENQSKEINRLNQETNNLNKEIEFLQQQNKILTQKIIHFRNQSSNIVENIEDNILKIEEILKNHDS